MKVARRAKALALPYQKRLRDFETRIPQLGVIVVESSLGRLMKAVERILAEAVGERAFRARASLDRENQQIFVAISHPKKLEAIETSRKKKFNSRRRAIKEGATDNLSIGLDFDFDPSKPYPVLLFVPDMKKAEHFHISLTREEAQRLKGWLEKFA